MWVNYVVIAAIIIVAVLVAIWMRGLMRRKRETETMREMLIRNAEKVEMPAVDFNSTDDVPAVVAEYFRHVMSENKKSLTIARFRQEGELKVNLESDRWSRFEAEHIVSVNEPAFVWDAKIRIAPFLHVRVRDSLINGVGAGHVSFLSAFTIGQEEDRPELNSGALYRYLAEAAWYPAALLQQSGVTWKKIDERRAEATLAHSGISVSLEFRFNERAEIAGIYTENRYGKFGDQYVQYPWEGHFSNYRDFEGIRIPTEAEVGWHLPEGRRLFWRGKIIDADFEFLE